MDAKVIEAGHRFRPGGSLSRAAVSADDAVAGLHETVARLRLENHPATGLWAAALATVRHLRATTGLPGARGPEAA